MSVKQPYETKVRSCSLLATFHQPFQRRRFSSFTSERYPIDGLASSSPVIGETMRGIWTPMPIPLSLM